MCWMSICRDDASAFVLGDDVLRIKIIALKHLFKAPFSRRHHKEWARIQSSLYIHLLRHSDCKA